ncbi:hypothetical protein MAR_029209 [Mya arenaria]|uniref:Uncharacterized protein n=1 Tax=Mya arenaria TaxID=6604 RepID=A0ABY7DGT6_MYAAR|nr:hypothetical protein MAR_029209 [Mya arenaria]
MKRTSVMIKKEETKADTQDSLLSVIDASLCDGKRSFAFWFVRAGMKSQCYPTIPVMERYLSYILHILVSPLPFLRLSLVVEAWARMWPPIGFFGSTANLGMSK